MAVVDLNRACQDLCERINMSTVDRGQATQSIVSHFRAAYPKYNVMVVHKQHLQSFEESEHSHAELKCSWFGTIGFEVFVFKRGLFTLLDDGGFDNWAFGGRFDRNDKTCNYSELAPVRTSVQIKAPNRAQKMHLEFTVNYPVQRFVTSSSKTKVHVPLPYSILEYSVVILYSSYFCKRPLEEEEENEMIL